MSKTKEKSIRDVWNEFKIEYAVYEFDCGGDSMGSTQLYFYDNKGNEIKKPKSQNGIKSFDWLCEYIEEDIYNQVEFYVNSDGHYIGERGKVTITLNTDNVDEDGEIDEDDVFFDYSKEAIAEFEENISNVIEVDITNDEHKVLKEYVDNIEGDSDNDEDAVYSYKKDFILTKDIQNVLDGLSKKIHKCIIEHDFEYDKGTYSDYDEDDNGFYSFELEKIVKNKGKTYLKVKATISVRMYQDSID